MSIVIGHDLFAAGGLKLNALSYFLYGLNAAGIFSTIYTIFVYDTTTGLNSMGYGAINCQVRSK